MALYLKENPIGKDAIIQSIQKSLFEAFSVPPTNPPRPAKWNLQLEAHGRVYLNELNGKIIPEAFVKKPKEYSGTLLTSDKSKFFFIEADSSPAQGQNRYKSTIDLCFIVDLGKIYPNIAHRADSEVHRDVEKVIDQFSYLGVVNEGLTTTSPKVFKGLFFKHTDDMQPKHVFKFTLTMFYRMDQTEC